MALKNTAVLINPPFERAVFRDHYCASEAKSAYLWHPLDLLIQGGCLKHAGYRVHGLDAIARGFNLPQTLRWAATLRPQVAVILVSERTWTSDRALISGLRESGVQTVVASGDFLRFGTAQAAEAEGLVDFVLTDFTTSHLPETLDVGSPQGGGVVTLEMAQRGEVRSLGRAPLDYPLADPRLFHPSRYRLPYPGFSNIASLLSTYGCPYHCRYCHVGELGSRLRPVEAILEEVRWLKKHGYQRFYFRDATLNTKRSHLLEWTKAMAKEGLSTPWAAFVTASPLDDELMQAMVASGCQHLQIGLETLGDELRDANGKPFGGEAHREMIALSHRHGIEVTAHLVLGLPGETSETLAKTAEGLAQTGLDYVAVNLAEDRPGLPWQKEGQRLAIALDPTRQGDLTPPVPLEQLKAAQSEAYRRFYLRPQRLVKELRSRVAYGDYGDLLAVARSVGGWR